jgi:hypothetical protein
MLIVTCFFTSLHIDVHVNEFIFKILTGILIKINNCICIKATIILIKERNFESKLFVNFYTVFFEGL